MEEGSSVAIAVAMEEGPSVTVAVEEKSSTTCSSSWVEDMEKQLEQADAYVEMARWRQHCIYRVPEIIKDTTNSKAYCPQFVSLGPLHHGEPHLLPMEQHKRRAVLHMVKRAGKPLGEFLKAVEEVADELEGAYDDLNDKWRGAGRGRFVEMMVTDGCFMLELVNPRRPRDYAKNDPIFGWPGHRSFWPYLRNDMIAMENQVPLVLLQRLLAVQGYAFPASSEWINRWVLIFLNRSPDVEDMDTLGGTPLDLYYKSYYGASHHWAGSGEYEERTPCAVELDEAGIQFKKSSTNSIHDVDFQNGVLSMSLFVISDNTENKFLNLMAYEWLNPDTDYYVADYISFMDKIIGSERDVALLRSWGIIKNITGSDKKVVEMFNSLTWLSHARRGSKLGNVVWKVNNHCRKRRNRWRASFVKTYLTNPWVFISLVAAVVLLGAAVLQTIYTVVPFYTKG